MTHPKTVSCPHVAEDWQWEVNRETCCTNDLGAIATALQSLGEADLAARLRSPVTAEEAIELGDELEIRGEKILNTDCGEPETDEQRAFLSNCETVCAAGDWYRKLGQAGFGVGLTRTLGMTLLMTDEDPLRAGRW